VVFYLRKRVDMEELSVEQRVEEGVGFVVGSHNYGRLDRLSLDEIGGMIVSVEELQRELAELREGLNHARCLQLEKRTNEFRDRSNGQSV